MKSIYSHNTKSCICRSYILWLGHMLPVPFWGLGYVFPGGFPTNVVWFDGSGSFIPTHLPSQQILSLGHFKSGHS